MRPSVAWSVAAVAAVVVTVVLAGRATDRLELPLRDAALRSIARVPAASTIVVAIDVVVPATTSGASASRSLVAIGNDGSVLWTVSLT